MKWKIAIVSELYGTRRQGGENVAMHNLYLELKKKNLAVNFFCYGNKNLPTLLLPRQLRLCPFLRDLFAPFLGIRTFLSLKKKYDLIFFSTPAMASFWCPPNATCWIHASRAMKISSFISSKKYRIIFNKLTLFIFKFLENRAYKNIKKPPFIISNRIKEYMGYKKAIVVPNFINSNRFKSLKVRKNYNIIFVGRFTEQKGADIILKIAGKRKDLSFLIITNILQDSFKEIKNLPNVTVMFNVPNKKMPYFYNSAELFFLPSRNEEQPLTILEAMACETLVLASNVGDVKFMLKDDYFYFDLSLCQNIEKKIDKILSLSKKDKEKIGFCFRKTILSEYSFSSFYKNFRQLL